MAKIAIGRDFPKNIIDLDFGIEKNIKLLADFKNVKTRDLTACVLKRPRHDSIIKSLKEMEVKINFISDGDVSGVISVAYPDKKIDIYIGIGGAPEGVLAAAALKCLDCQMQTRLHFLKDDEKTRAKKLGIIDLNKKYNVEDMVKGDVIFCATGVTDGDFVKGIKDLGNKYYSETLTLHSNSKTNTIFKNQNKK
jgi:fructose-1,6-bisphosphatase II / sedoheptulose-1,7-bisphosphatase